VTAAAFVVIGGGPAGVGYARRLLWAADTETPPRGLRREAAASAGNRAREADRPQAGRPRARTLSISSAKASTSDSVL
jgi:hypothetical protein